MKTNNKNKKKEVSTEIDSWREIDQDENITKTEVEAQKESKNDKDGILSDEEVKASVELINPDEGTRDRG